MLFLLELHLTFNEWGFVSHKGSLVQHFIKDQLIGIISPLSLSFTLSRQRHEETTEQHQYSEANSSTRELMYLRQMSCNNSCFSLFEHAGGHQSKSDVRTSLSYCVLYLLYIHPWDGCSKLLFTLWDVSAISEQQRHLWSIGMMQNTVVCSLYCIRFCFAQYQIWFCGSSSTLKVLWRSEHLPTLTHLTIIYGGPAVNPKMRQRC